MSAADGPIAKPNGGASLLEIRVAVDHREILVMFGTSIAQFALSPDAAIGFATHILMATRAKQ